jgi:hypothetical protein
MDQNVKLEQKLNEINHDYQRMRKLAKKRRLGVLTRANKMRAQQEKELQKKLGGEAWIDLKRISVVEASVWVAVGLIIGFWIH